MNPSLVDRASSPLTSLVDRAQSIFERHFGRRPSTVAWAPGRINLIGEHVDYNGGYALPLAIDRYTVMVAARSPAGAPVRIWSQTFRELAEFSAQPTHPSGPSWAAYVQGVLAQLARRGWPAVSFDAVIESSLPLGSGLSSSAALEVATATLLEGLAGGTLEPLVKADVAQAAEREFTGVPCGKMDQLASIGGQLGKLLLLDCLTNEVRAIPWRCPQVALVVIDSKVPRRLAQGAYQQRFQECQQALGELARARGLAAMASSWRQMQAADLNLLDDHPVWQRRARHIISELQRTLQAAEAAAGGDVAALGRLLDEGHRSLRDDFEVSCPQVDWLVQQMQQLGPAAGVWGARLTGAGFGGCTINLVRQSNWRAIVEPVLEQYRAQTGLSAEAFCVTPVAGAGGQALST